MADEEGKTGKGTKAKMKRGPFQVRRKSLLMLVSLTFHEGHDEAMDKAIAHLENAPEGEWAAEAVRLICAGAMALNGKLPTHAAAIPAVTAPTVAAPAALPEDAPVASAAPAAALALVVEESDDEVVPVFEDDLDFDDLTALNL